MIRTQDVATRKNMFLTPPGSRQTPTKATQHTQPTTLLTSDNPDEQVNSKRIPPRRREAPSPKRRQYKRLRNWKTYYPASQQVMFTSKSEEPSLSRKRPQKLEPPSVRPSRKKSIAIHLRQATNHLLLKQYASFSRVTIPFL
jgi:hypothetical protein